MSILKRSITPIFNFKFEGDDDEFTCSGDYNGANYTVSLKHHGPISLAEINRMDNEKSNWENFVRILDIETKILFESPQRSIYKFGITAFHFLVVDV